MRHAPGSRYGGVLAVALVAALLLCHGPTGLTHLPAGSVAASEAHAHGGVETGVPADHHGGSGGTDCYVSVLLAAALWISAPVRLTGFRSRGLTETPASRVRAPVRVVPLRSRAPAPAFLGVFRL